jgi:uncharacterized protein (DUF2384 family)
MVMTVPELIELKDHLELSPEAFAGITGVSFHRIRRGRIRGAAEILPDRQVVVDRCKKLYAIAIDLCGQHDPALDWIYSQSPALGDVAPIDLTAIPAGFQKIETLISTLKRAAQSITTPRIEVQPVGLPTPKLTDKLQIKDRIKEARSRLPDLTKAEVARRMQKMGFKKFTGATLWRYEIGYEASWKEIEALATVLGVSPHWLAGIDNIAGQQAPSTTLPQTRKMRR